jgi:hypothetical protein
LPVAGKVEYVRKTVVLVGKYVGRDAEAMADEIWQAAERVGTSRFENRKQEVK